jgi:hypothetical protein
VRSVMIEYDQRRLPLSKLLKARFHCLPVLLLLFSSCLLLLAL